MTLIVGIRTDECLVLASDSRVTGLATFDSYKKVNALGRHCVLTSGDGGFTGRIIIEHGASIAAAETVEVAANIIAGACRALVANWPANQQANAQILLMVAGPSIGGGRAIYLIFPSAGNYSPQLQANYGAIGGNTAICAAQARLAKIYRSSLSKTEAKQLAALCIAEASTIDASVGGPIQMAVIEGGAPVFVSVEECASLASRSHEKLNEFMLHVFDPPLPPKGK